MSIKGYLYKLLHSNNVKTLFLIDILHMKDINAIYDFHNGDHIIRQLKNLLKTKLCKLICKKLKKKLFIELKNIHSDVFALTIYANLNQNEIIEIKNLIYKKIISHNFNLKNTKTTINVDITVGCSKSKNKNLRAYAEKALYNAKLNFLHFTYYDTNLYENEDISKNTLELLTNNINNQSVEPYFQAIMDNKTDKIIKYEALMRIFDKDGNILSPYTFIHKAKKSRLYYQLMEILIDKTIKYISQYKKHISINLDYTDILNPYIKKSLISKINKYHIGEYLTIEILEGEKINNYNIVNDFIADVKKYGVKIAIDDFGTGFSNYEYILNLNIDYIKIDGSLIKKINEDIYLNLIKSIVLFCKEQNIKIIAEFVSDLKTLRYVKAIDIDYSQGYYIQKPLSIKEIIGEENEKRA